jgi:hypothetical protein
MKTITLSHFFAKLATLAMLTTACSFLSASDSSSPNAPSNSMKKKQFLNHLTGSDQTSGARLAKKHENKHITLFVTNFTQSSGSFSFRVGVGKPDGKITWSEPIIMNSLPTTPWELCRIYKPEDGVYSVVVELLKVDSEGTVTMTTQATNSEDEHKYLNTFTLSGDSQYVDQRFVMGTFLFRKS